MCQCLSCVSNVKVSAWLNLWGLQGKKLFHSWGVRSHHPKFWALVVEKMPEARR